MAAKFLNFDDDEDEDVKPEIPQDEVLKTEIPQGEVLKTEIPQDEESSNPYERSWNNGFFKVRKNDEDVNLPNSVIMRPNLQCFHKSSNEFILVETERMKKQEFLNSIPLIYGRPTEPGYYTWIVYSSKTEKKQLVCCKALSILEIGTVHKALAYRVNAEVIHAAGEVFIGKDRKLYFNFMSGTFMRDAFSKNKRDFSPEEMMFTLIFKMKEPSYFGKDSEWRSSTFFTEKDLPVSDKELESYQRFGAVVERFPTKEECEKKKGGGKRRRTHKLRRRYRKKRNSITLKRSQRK
jgi:hypothetical protein